MNAVTHWVAILCYLTTCVIGAPSTRSAILLLAPDRNYQHELLFDDGAHQRAQACWEGNCATIHTDHSARWNLGAVVWEEIMQKQSCMISHFDVYFLKYDVSREHGYVNVTAHNYTSTIVVGRQPDEWYRNNDTVNSLTYKSIMAMKYLLQSPSRKYDFFVRGNANVIIDLLNFQQYLEIAPRKKLYTSPFWQGGSYAYGYFILMSDDVARWSVDHFGKGAIQKLQRKQARKYKRRVSHGADDCDLALLATSKHGSENATESSSWAYPSKKNVIPGGNSLGRDKHRRYSLKNMYGIRIDDDNGDHGGPWNFSDAKHFLSTRENSTFLYRIKDTMDHHLIDLIKIITSHLTC